MLGDYRSISDLESRVARDLAATVPVAIARASALRAASAQPPRFWKEFLEHEPTIILGRFSHFRDAEESGLVGVGDAMGAIELRDYLAAFSTRPVPIAWAQQVSGHTLKNNIILLGGPDANFLAGEAVDRLRTGFEVVTRDPRTRGIGGMDQRPTGIYDRRTDTYLEVRYRAALGRRGAIYRGVPQEISTDLAVIVSTVNPFSRARRAMVLFGVTGYGSWAGARLVQSPEFLEEPLVSAGRSCECLIEVDILQEVPQQSRILVFRALES